MNDASYVIALYIRLSIEDSKVDSMSIHHQFSFSFYFSEIYIKKPLSGKDNGFENKYKVTANTSWKRKRPFIGISDTITLLLYPLSQKVSTEFFVLRLVSFFLFPPLPHQP